MSWCVLAVAAVAIAGCGGGISSDAVVSVDGTSITKATFNHWMTIAASSGVANAGGKPVVPEPPSYTACIAHLKATAAKPAKGQKGPTEASLKSECEQQYKSLQQEVLGYLISSSWMSHEANSLGVKVSEKEVRKKLETIKSQEFPKAGEFEKFLKTSGETVSDLLLRVKLSMLEQKVQTAIVKKHKSASEAQAKKYYNENKSRYGSPEKRAVYVILTKTEAAAKSAKKEIESGKGFASVAKKDSIEPTSKSTGGLLPEVVKGEETKPFDAAIFSAKKGVLGGPVKTPFGYYVFEVKSVKASGQQSFAQVKHSVEAQLASSNESQALSTFAKEFKKKWIAKTECRAGYVVADCKSYKAPKPTPAEATGTVK
jgi:foldase protein PrsA